MQTHTNLHYSHLQVNFCWLLCVCLCLCVCVAFTILTPYWVGCRFLSPHLVVVVYQRFCCALASPASSSSLFTVYSWHLSLSLPLPLRLSLWSLNFWRHTLWLVPLTSFDSIVFVVIVINFCYCSRSLALRALCGCERAVTPRHTRIVCYPEKAGSVRTQAHTIYIHTYRLVYIWQAIELCSSCCCCCCCFAAMRGSSLTQFSVRRVYFLYLFVYCCYCFVF